MIAAKPSAVDASTARKAIVQERAERIYIAGFWGAEFSNAETARISLEAAEAFQVAIEARK